PISPLSLHDALPIYRPSSEYEGATVVRTSDVPVVPVWQLPRGRGDADRQRERRARGGDQVGVVRGGDDGRPLLHRLLEQADDEPDRKSTRLNSSHVA